MIRILASISILLLPIPAAGQDWPMWRHDAQRTGRQSLPGMIDVPTVKWAQPVGGRLESSQFLALDVDLDGRTEAVVLRGGRAVARRFDGALRWATEPLGLDVLLAASDFDADGRPEVFAASHVKGLFVLSGSSGGVLWRTLPDPSSRLYTTVFPIDADGDGRDELYVADWGCAMGGAGTARVYSFASGFSGSTPAVVLDTSAHGYWCGLWQGSGDVDGDTLPEIVALSHDRVIVYDPRLGSPVYRSEVLPAFPYGIARTYAADVDEDGRDEIVVASNNPAGTYPDTRQLSLLEVEGGALVLRWRIDVPGATGDHRFPSPPIGRLLPGRGRMIVTSVYVPVPGRWELRVIAETSTDGSPSLILPDRIALAVADLDADGLDEVVSLDAVGPSPLPFGTIRAFGLEAGPPLAARELWRVESAGMPLAPASWHLGDRPVYLAPRGGRPRATLVWRDTESDGRADLLVAAGPDDPSAWPARVLDAAAEPTGARSLPGESAAALARSDGSLELLDGALSVINDDVPPFGVADLVERNYLVDAAGLAVLADSSGPLLAFVDASGRLRSVRTARASPVAPPAEAWTTAPSAGRWSRAEYALHPTAPAVVSWLREANGTLAVAALDAGAGEEITRFPLADSARVRPYWSSRFTQLRTSPDRYPFLVVATHDMGDETVRYYRLGIDDGSVLPFDNSRTTTGTGDGPGSAWDWTADGVDDLYIDQGVGTPPLDENALRIVDGATGRTVHQRSFGWAGAVAFVDLDRDGDTDILRSWAVTGLRRLTPDLDPVWQVAAGISHGFAAAAPSAAAGMNVGSAQMGSARFTIFRGTDGATLASLVLAGGRAFADEAEAAGAGVVPGVLSAVSAADDLTGFGHASFLLGSTDGYLYAVSAEDGTIDWALNLHAAVGEPIVADVDADGLSEVLAPCGDGAIYAIDRAEVDAPTAVYDTDGSFVAVSPEDDLDEIADSTTVGANWSAVAGAGAYECQIRTWDDVVVTPWTDVGAATRTVRRDLALQWGRRYKIAVRARAGSGSDVRVSPEAASDGFVVVDRDPPTVTVSVTPPRIFPGSDRPDSAATLGVLAQDRVGLRSYAVHVTDIAGLGVRELARAEIGGTRFLAEMLWDGRDDSGVVAAEGTYRVVATATDVAGREGAGSATVVVCRSSGSDAGPCAEEPGDGGTDDAQATDGATEGTSDGTMDRRDAGDEDVGVGTGAHWQGHGSGCGCRALGSSRSTHPIGILLAAAWWWRRRRPWAKLGSDTHDGGAPPCPTVLGSAGSVLDNGLVDVAQLLAHRWPLPRGRTIVPTTLLDWVARRRDTRRVINFSDDRRFLLDLSNPMHRQVFLTGTYEPAETGVLAALLRPGDRAIDLGANFGWFALLMATRVGPAGLVHAFEPLPAAARDLRVNIALSGMADRIQVHEVAVGRAPGETTIHSFAGLPQGHASESTLGRGDHVGVRVPVVTLDEFLAGPAAGGFSLMKCDVEGAEMNVLLGAASLLASRDAPIVLCEMNDETSAAFGYRPPDLLEALRARGYADFYRIVADPRPNLVALAHPDQIRHGDNVLCVPPSRRDRVETAAATLSRRRLR